MTAIRLLPWLVKDGPWNMAADEVMLSSAANGVASLRFYGWTDATLSLGYFQPHAPARAMPNLAPLDWVRRPSGGSALVHHHEVTYALALPPSMARRESWLIRMHEVIRETLASFGVAAQLCEQEVIRGEVLCFLHHTPGDLVIGESKIVGSAHRKGHGAVMQHGSILLRQSPHTPELPGIAELSGREIGESELIAALSASIQRRLGWALNEGAWSIEEASHCGELAIRRYGDPAWNEKR